MAGVDIAGSLEPLIRPSSVAVVGASPDATRYPGKVIRNLKRYGFQGRIYGVNPKYEEILGYPCYPDISRIGEPVDAALIMLAAERAPAALEAAIDAGSRSAIVFASGMAETGAEGNALQREVGRIASEAGIRVLGPNCLGLINLRDGIMLCGAAALERDTPPVRGGVGLAAQSGGVMGSILDRGWEEGVGFSFAFSTGNEADLTLADCLEFMVSDPATRAVALFVEAVREVPRFRAACERAAEMGKPVAVLKMGRSEHGRQVALTHTAALTGSDAAFQALFDRLGVVRVMDLDELFTVPALLARTPLPRGRNLAIACSSGGIAGLSADLCQEYDIKLADLSAETLGEIRELQAGFGGAYNPLDITGHVVSKEHWWKVRRIHELLLADPAVDMLVIGQPTSHFADEAAEDIVATATAATKPVVALWTGRRANAKAHTRLREAGVLLFEQPDLCYRTVRSLFRFTELREKRARARRETPAPIDSARRQAALRLCSASPAGMSEHESKALLALYGIAVSPESVVRSTGEAIEAGGQLGYPVAVKAHGRGLQHKSDRNAVRVNVADAAAVAAAYLEVTEAAGTQEALVARMAPPGLELILGLNRDPEVGLLLLAGIGGIFVELLQDVATAVAPLWPGEASEMLARLRGARLMQGVRGRPPLDRESAVAALEALSLLAAEIGHAVEQIDVNPLMVGPVGSGAQAVDALVIPRRANL